jgi:hypothetical protein
VAEKKVPQTGDNLQYSIKVGVVSDDGFSSSSQTFGLVARASPGKWRAWRPRKRVYLITFYLELISNLGVTDVSIRNLYGSMRFPASHIPRKLPPSTCSSSNLHLRITTVKHDPHLILPRSLSLEILDDDLVVCYPRYVPCRSLPLW